MLEKELSNFKKYFAKHRRKMTMLESGVLDEFIQYLSSRRTKRAPDGWVCTCEVFKDTPCPVHGKVTRQSTRR